jgi:hypothetical protein
MDYAASTSERDAALRATGRLASQALTSSSLHTRHDGDSKRPAGNPSLAIQRANVMRERTTPRSLRSVNLSSLIRVVSIVSAQQTAAMLTK